MFLVDKSKVKNIRKADGLYSGDMLVREYCSIYTSPQGKRMVCHRNISSDPKVAVHPGVHRYRYTLEGDKPQEAYQKSRFVGKTLMHYTPSSGLTHRSPRGGRTGTATQKQMEERSGGQTHVASVAGKQSPKTGPCMHCHTPGGYTQQLRVICTSLFTCIILG
jgi:hypothetical protein